LLFGRLRERHVASIDCGQQTPAREVGHDDENCPYALVDGGLRSAQPCAGPVVVEPLPLQPHLLTSAYATLPSRDLKPASAPLALSLVIFILTLSFFFGYFHEPVRTRTLKGALVSIIIVRSQAIHNAIARLPARLPYEPSDVEVLLFGNRDRYCPTIRYLPLWTRHCFFFLTRAMTSATNSGQWRTFVAHHVSGTINVLVRYFIYIYIYLFCLIIIIYFFF